MRPLLQHAQRSLFSDAGLIIPKRSIRSYSNIITALSSAPPICLQCQYRVSAAFRPNRYPQRPSQASSRRSFHQSGGQRKPTDESETPEERLARVREDIALRERQEKKRQEKERQERERQERERQEREKQEKERQEKERQEKERQEEERRQKGRERHIAPQKSVPDVIELPSSRPAPRTENKSLPDVAELSSSDTVAPSTKEEASKDNIHKADFNKGAIKEDTKRVFTDKLPSHHQAQRWDLSKRFQELMDDILPKLAVVTQKVNTYTGTDYSGIEALKREIKEQEKLVKARRAAIETAKQALDAAHSKQASSQKEVVALLERKHSWSDTDLERYMSLIRSEHINDQAVREAKEAIAQAENALEEARSQLEKRERAQYHEEQIWSDTIRRNSTWVTFGLMGLNIFLLLVTMVVIEPWRRRRMVREIKNALEAQKTAVEPAPTAHAQATAPAAIAPIVAAEVGKEVEPDKTVTPSPDTGDLVDSASPIQHDTEFIAKKTAEVKEVPTVASAAPTAIGDASTAPDIAPVAEEEATPLEPIDVEEEAQISPSSALETWQDKVTYIAKDIFSDRSISMRRVDYTAAILQGAAAGAVITAAVVAIIVGR